MSIQNPGRFGLKTFLVGLAIGVTVGIGLVASAICPPVVVIPAVLIFVFANSPLFAWAGAHAAVAVIAAAGVLAGLATTLAVQTIDVIASAIWRVGCWFAGTCSKKETPADQASEMYLSSSYKQMADSGLQGDGDINALHAANDMYVEAKPRQLGRRADLSSVPQDENSSASRP